MTQRNATPVRWTLVAALVAGFIPTLPAAAERDRTDWAQAFERARRESAGFAVESVEEFRKLTEHRESLASDGVTVGAFDLPGGGQVRCVEVSSQKSLAASGQPLQLAPGTLPAEDAVAPRAPAASADPRGSEFGLDGTRDPAGNERACPSGSFPQLLPRLEDLYRFHRFDDLFRKTPAGSGTPKDQGAPAVAGPQSSATAVHEYAHAYQWVNNSGMRADFNLWSPAVEQTAEFSLSQLWVTRGQTADNSLQTAETGWQNYQQLYGDARSHLFIYYTSGNYQNGTGCYNLTCSAFVQTDSGVVIGGGFTAYSTPGGTQYELALAFYRDPSAPHHWWLKYGNTWVGYFPNSLFNAQGIANYSDHIDFGGEIVDTFNGGLHTTTDMGSGRFPSEGSGAAAYTRRIQYFDTSGYAWDAGSLNRSVTDASYYDLALGSSSEPLWARYFFFGGPGRTASSAGPQAAFTFSPNPATAGQPVQFGEASTGSPTSWSWTFGDGGTSTSQFPSHTFGAGTFQVSLTVSNTNGSSTATHSVPVNAASSAGCTSDAYTMCLVNGRYRVTGRWRNQYAGGAAANLYKTKLTEATGAFWLFDSDTFEYLIRITTATNNGRAWISIPTFTSVEFWIAVTDTVNGQSHEYHSSPGNVTLIYDPSTFVYP